MNKIITVLSDYHQKEYNALFDAIEANYLYNLNAIYMNALNSRMSWLEYQAKLKVESILELCRTGK